MPQVSILSANIGAVIAQSFLYGVFVLLFAVCIYVLQVRVRPNTYASQRPNRSFGILLLVTSVVLFLLITAGWIIWIVRIIQGFVTYRDDPGTELFFNTPTLPANIAELALYISQTLAADAIVIYRLYVIWNRKFGICIFPTLCWLACAASGILIIIDMCRTKLTIASVIHLGSIARKPILIGSSATLILNVFCTIMISMRVWIVTRRVKSVTQLQSKFFNVTQLQSKFFRSIRIIVDSAAIYTAFFLATLIAYLAESNIGLPLIACTGPIIGLTFCLIIVRANLSGNQHGESTVEERHQPASSTTFGSLSAVQCQKKSYFMGNGLRVEMIH